MLNDVDRAIVAAIRSRANLPDLFRVLLAQEELFFLVPFHPEVAGEEVELRSDMPLPFVQLADKQGTFVPIFSSCERADEGMEKGGVPPNTYLPAAMPAVQILEILGRASLRAALNLSCSTGTITLPPDLLRDLASGEALGAKPATQTGTREEGTVQSIDPADYPTDLVQRLFESLRKYPQFRAAWIFTLPEEKRASAGARYQVLVLMDPRDDAAYNDLRLVAATKAQGEDDVALGLLDETDSAALKKLYASAEPFYRAATPPQ